MATTIERVTENNQGELIRYSAQHGPEHDSSYLPGRDFNLTEEYPSYLLSQNGKTVGAVSLIRNQRYIRVSKARFAIFHSTLKTKEAYSLLLEAVRPHFHGLKSAFLFLPREERTICSMLEELGFQIERYSFVLERDALDSPPDSFPEGYSIQAVEPGDQASLEQFTRCQNEEFSELAGHTPATPANLANWFEGETYLEGGMCLLKKGQVPVGTIWVMRDSDNHAAGEILSFGIVKAERGLNLGRNLLRFGVNFAREMGLNPVILSVNAENENALRLYLSEGFRISEALVCYQLKLERAAG